MNNPKKYIFLITLLFNALISYADVFYVTTSGVDTSIRDGKSISKSWKTLSYACTRVPEGNHEIRLSAGIFIESNSSIPKSGISIIGNGFDGVNKTVIKASSNWVLNPDPKSYSPSNYIIGISTWAMGFSKRVHDLTIRDIYFESDTSHLIDGAIFFRDLDNITMYNLHIENFRWAGMRLEFCDNLKVYDSKLINTNREEHGDFSGNIHTRWNKNSEFYNLDLISNLVGDRKWGVGYKGEGHEHVKIHDCFFKNGGFDIEIPHDNEYGVEVYNCSFSSPVSIPKPGQGDNPNKRGVSYSFWFHDNYTTSSYAFEGPRNHLKISNNFMEINSTNGRIYSQFGGYTTGPMWIHHNVIVNVDRSFVWKGDGQLDSVYIYNNTVYFHDAADRAAPVLDSWNNMKGWRVQNNIFIAPSSQPRRIGGGRNCGTCDQIDVISNNLTQNITEMPSTGNFIDQNPQLVNSGQKPYPYYAPMSGSFVINKGINVGLPFKGIAPDIGAYEFDNTSSINSNYLLNKDFTLFPVPASNDITIWNKNMEEINSIDLIDMEGKIIFSDAHKFKSIKKQLNISECKPGNYVIRITKANMEISILKMSINR